MLRARVTFTLVLVALLLTQAGGAAQAQGNQVALTVRAGFDGLYKDAMWIPVRVTLTNNGGDLNGTVKISMPRYDGSTADYTRPVELPAGARKEIFMFVLAEGYVTKITVSYVEGKQTLGASSARVTQSSSSDLLYGVLAASPSAFNVLTRIDPLNGQGKVAQLTVDDLPPLTQAWKALDVLIVSDVDTGQLSQKQIEAMKAWLSGGGRLVVAGGPNWQKVAAGLADLLPLVPARTESITSLAPLGAYAQESAPEGSLIAVSGELRPGAVSLVSAGTPPIPLLIEQTYGYGKVDMLAFDPALSPIKGWSGAEGTYRNLLSSSIERPGWSNTYRNWYNAGEAVNSIPGIGLPHVLQVCTFLGGYVLAVGPLNYFILRRFKRRELAWITIPVLVLLFAAITYVASYGLRGTRPTLHRLTVAQVWENSDRAQVESLVGIFSPGRDEYDLRADGDLLLQPFPSDTYYGSVDTSLGGAQIEQSDAAFIRGVRVDVGAIKPFLAQGQVAAPTFKSDLTYSVAGAKATLDGTVSNLSDLTLHDAVILAAGGAQKVGDIGPGENADTRIVLSASRATWAMQTAAQISPPGVAPFLSYYPGYYNSGYDTTIDDFLGTSSYYDDRETYRRYSLLTWLFDPYNSGGRGSGTYLVGWADTSPVQVSLVGRKFNVSDLTLYIVRLEPKVVVSRGAISVPPGLMTWEVIDPGSGSGGSPYDSYLSQGYFALRYTPAVALDFESVKSLTLHLTSYGLTGSTGLMIRLLDQSEGRWVELDNPGWGDTAINVPARFVGQDGHIDVQIENPSFQNSVTIETLDLTLVVQR